MSRFDGSLARTLDFGDTTTTAGPGVRLLRVGLETEAPAGAAPVGLRLALPGGVPPGSDKYKVLERRRRQAQIAARRVLDLIDVAERAGRDTAGTEEGK
jgi:hypothetical protein